MWIYDLHSRLLGVFLLITHNESIVPLIFRIIEVLHEIILITNEGIILLAEINAFLLTKVIL